MSLRFADGSLATISYCSAIPSTGKERIELMTDAHRLTIDDFRSVKLDGKTLWKGRHEKGQRAQAAAFWQAVHGGSELPTEPMLATMRATIQAAQVG